jgi:hypothetical protein
VFTARYAVSPHMKDIFRPYWVKSVSTLQYLLLIPTRFDAY